MQSQMIASHVLILSVALLMVACADDRTAQLPQALDYPEPDSQGASVLLEKCAGCHVAPLPGTHMAKIWPSVVERMQQQMKLMGKPGLNADEKQQLLDYLQRHAAPEESP